MECPKCKQGKIRVVKEVICSCGHHPLVCDHCFSFFTVECGEPYGENKLPPDYPMTLNKEMTESQKKVVSFFKIKDEKAKKLALQAFKRQIINAPLLEDFKVSFAERTA